IQSDLEFPSPQIGASLRPNRRADAQSPGKGEDFRSRQPQQVIGFRFSVFGFRTIAEDRKPKTKNRKPKACPSASPTCVSVSTSRKRCCRSILLVFSASTQPRR